MAIRAGVWEALSALKTCAVHGGRFRATETPGVLWTDCDHRFGAFVVTRDTPVKRAKEKSLLRGKAARSIVHVLLLIPRARWGLSGICAAEDLRAGKLYSGEVDKAGVALWAVTWRQAMLREVYRR